MTAADASAELLAGLPDGRRRRVVVVAETAAADGAVPLARRGRGARRHRGRRGPDDDLAWWATQEIGDLVASR